MADVLVLYNNTPGPVGLNEAHIEQMRRVASGSVYWRGTEAEALSEGLDTEVAFIWGGSGPQPVEYCLKSKNLRWIHSFSAGLNPIMDSPIARLDVRLTNAKGIHGGTMALTTMGYIVALLRDFPGLYRNQANHVWQKSTDPLPREAEGLTLCILGAGAIGGEVARLAKAFGMRVTGVKRSVAALERYDAVYPAERMGEAVGEADFVVVLVPATPDTYHMVDAGFLAGMKKTACLINISRGSVVDGDALAEALREGRIAGAALDAVEDEPLSPDSPLWDMRGVIITPHCSADTAKYMDRAVAQFCELLRLYEAGEPLFNEIGMGQTY
ncbi:MAG: D-2-hydroxyacid dehydrogenase [Clostridiales Family XIII bacterium]|jgi:phosphoglycerate dehydrogenase-like enzyme|nr:D-2-hydroxyacid dehydrogenase [Clostridiales Family XIII bacterium]